MRQMVTRCPGCFSSFSPLTPFSKPSRHHWRPSAPMRPFRFSMNSCDQRGLHTGLFIIISKEYRA